MTVTPESSSTTSGGKISSKLSLIDQETEDFTPEFEAVLNEIFERYDKDNDNEWSLQELQNYAIDMNGVEFDADTLSEIYSFFTTSPNSSDPDGRPNLTKAGFLELYHLQSTNDEDETWKDLKKLGYAEDLKLIGKGKEDNVVNGNSDTAKTVEEEEQPQK
ncbi:hypothetical protein BKA69DRAFT_1128192 [Paraphysoderma sedebokerense]|nr:hypothetical protein BKA69DRAFT_1128192 [Paraphysoderma sedebokerense]